MISIDLNPRLINGAFILNGLKKITEYPEIKPNTNQPYQIFLESF